MFGDNSEQPNRFPIEESSVGKYGWEGREIEEGWGTGPGWESREGETSQPWLPGGGVQRPF